MEPNYKITIPKPCHENWNQMTPDATGRFCNSCAKSVVDFTRMKTPEIQDYFIKNQGKNVCGRFKTEQLDSIIIQIPREVLFSQVHFHKMFLLALLLTMGTTLFSCQNNDGGKQKIDGVEIVGTSHVSSTVGAPMAQEDSLKINTTLPNTKMLTLKFNGSNSALQGFTVTKLAVDSLTGDVDLKTAEPSTNIMQEDDFIYGTAGISVYPDFPGGIPNFYDFVKKQYTFPKKSNRSQGILKASFVIEKDGALDEIKIMSDMGHGLGDELTRVLIQSPKWNPAEQNGKKQRINFELNVVITNDVVPSLFGKKTVAKIDSIQLIRITELDN